MSMSSSGVESQEVPVPVKSFSYRDMGAPVPFQVNETKLAGPPPEPERAPQPAPGVSPQEMKESAECGPGRGRRPDRSTPQGGI